MGDKFLEKNLQKDYSNSCDYGC